jgi:hypothetical protein
MCVGFVQTYRLDSLVKGVISMMKGKHGRVLVSDDSQTYRSIDVSSSLCEWAWWCGSRSEFWLQVQVSCSIGGRLLRMDGP